VLTWKKWGGQRADFRCFIQECAADGMLANGPLDEVNASGNDVGIAQARVGEVMASVEIGMQFYVR